MWGEPKLDKKDALCKKHTVVTTTLASKPCPECGKGLIAADYKRCFRCAKRSNKCSLCDDPLV